MFCFYNRENLDVLEYEDENFYNLCFGYIFDNRNDIIFEYSICCFELMKF